MQIMLHKNNEWEMFRLQIQLISIYHSQSYNRKTEQHFLYEHFPVTSQCRTHINENSMII